MYGRLVGEELSISERLVGEPCLMEKLIVSLCQCWIREMYEWDSSVVVVEDYCLVQELVVSSFQQLENFVCENFDLLEEENPVSGNLCPGCI